MERTTKVIKSKEEFEFNVCMTIPEARRVFKMKQKTLAELAGITSVELCRIERNQIIPHKSTINKIENALGMHLDIPMDKSVKMMKV